MNTIQNHFDLSINAGLWNQVRGQNSPAPIFYATEVKLTGFSANKRKHLRWLMTKNSFLSEQNVFSCKTHG